MRTVPARSLIRLAPWSLPLVNTMWYVQSKSAPPWFHQGTQLEYKIDLRRLTVAKLPAKTSPREIDDTLTSDTLDDKKQRYDNRWEPEDTCHR